MATRLELVNFRSYAHAVFELAPYTVVVGENAAGKTNLLEALYLLACAKSFRADREKEMVRWGEPVAKVSAELTRGATHHEVSVRMEAGERSVKKATTIDGKRRPTRELLRNFPMVLFSADDSRLIDGSPGRRRRALDLAISQASSNYQSALSRYGRVVASRNRLLEEIASGEASGDELDFWDEQLVASGQVIVDERQAFVNDINESLTDAYRAIAEDTRPNERLQLSYEPLVADMSVAIPERRRQDLAVGTTTAGPHRDDWRLLLGNRPLASFGSGGEFRSAVLALRQTEGQWLGQRLGVAPILLLDDVFSELDAGRRTALLAGLPQSQVIITTPEPQLLSTAFRKQAEIIEITPGLNSNV